MAENPFTVELFDGHHPMAELVGATAINWNMIQSIIYVMFLGLSGMPQDKAEVVFNGVRNDRTQRTITKKVGEISLRDNPEVLGRFVAMMDEIEQAQGGRNLIVHGWFAADEEGSLAAFPVGSSKSSRKTLTLYEEHHKLLEEIVAKANGLLSELFALPSWPQIRV